MKNLQEVFDKYGIKVEKDYNWSKRFKKIMNVVYYGNHCPNESSITYGDIKLQDAFRIYKYENNKRLLLDEELNAYEYRLLFQSFKARAYTKWP